MKNLTHLNIGDINNHVAFLFSCPGKAEEKLKKPVAGLTGKHLDILLEYLESKDKTNFKFKDRYSYRITNSWKEIEYKKKTSRTEAKMSEIKQKENLVRIKNELNNIKILILFGVRACKIIKFLEFDGVIIKSRHLSSQGLAHVKEDIFGNSLKIKAEGNTQKRIEFIGSLILNDISNFSK